MREQGEWDRKGREINEGCMTELLTVVGSLLLGIFRSTLQKAPLNCPRKERNTNPLAPIPFGLRFAIKNVNFSHTWCLAALIMGWVFFCGFGESLEVEKQTLAHACVWTVPQLHEIRAQARRASTSEAPGPCLEWMLHSSDHWWELKELFCHLSHRMLEFLAMDVHCLQLQPGTLQTRHFSEDLFFTTT